MVNFNGYFIYVKTGNNTWEEIPNNYISLNSYISTPHQRQDLDSYQDNNGVLHRNVVKHYRSKCEFNTPPLLESELEALQDIIDRGITYAGVPKERKIIIRHYCFDTHKYEPDVDKEADYYIPDIEFKPLKLTSDGKVLMDKVRFAFIEY